MPRETYVVTLPVSGVEVVLNKYLLGRDRRALSNVYLDNGLTIGEDGKIAGVSSKITDAAQDLAWKTVIVSVGGNSTDIVKSILDLSDTDYSFITDEVNKITSNKISEEKKTI